MRLLPCIIFILALGCRESNPRLSNKAEEDVLPEKTEYNWEVEEPKINVERTNIYTESSIKPHFDLTSQLEEKVERLSKLEHQYMLKQIGRIEIEKSRLIAGLERRSNEDTNRPEEVKGINIEEIKSRVYETRQAMLKAAKTITPNGNTYPRATIEEYIFNSIDGASRTFELLMKWKENEKDWIMIAKEPHSLFLEDNRLYFISSGGWYMMNMYKEIEHEMKKKP